MNLSKETNNTSLFFAGSTRKGYVNDHKIDHRMRRCTSIDFGKDDVRMRKLGKAEIDFVIQKDADIIPIEVKTNIHVKARSLDVYMKTYNPRYAIRISEKNFGFENNIKSVPLYATFCI